LTFHATYAVYPVPSKIGALVDGFSGEALLNGSPAFLEVEQIVDSVFVADC